MLIPWLWIAPLVALCSAGSGSSLRGAVEALQRRQRGHIRGPMVPSTDYDALYEFIPPGYPESDYIDDVDIQEEPNPKYIVKLLDENDRSPETYEYKVIKKKSSKYDAGPRKESAFRERSHHADNDRLRDLFADRNEEDPRKNEVFQEKAENDAEYALLLSQLWAKYKNNKLHASPEPAPQGVVKLYKEKIVKKRYPDNWGPIAFKRKRSSDSDILEHPIPQNYEPDPKAGTPDSNYNAYDVSDDDKDDWREEYSIAFQPLDDDSLSDLSDDDQYSYDTVEKRFPVTKRSSGPYAFNNHMKRFAGNQKLKTKTFRSSAGTDPRIIKDLSKIFGDMDIKNPVKRSAEQEESHEGKPPQLTPLINNKTHDHNNASKHDEDSHEHHGHNMHHPGISGKESEHTHDHSHDHSHDNNHDNSHSHNHDHDHAHHEKPKIIRKKSIDWSDYFGIDKRTKKYVNDVNQDRLRKQYFDTFNKEVMYPVNSFRKHSFVKRNYVEKPNEDNMQQFGSHAEEKRDTAKENDSKLDNIDKKLRNMEGMLVDDALRYSEVDEELDSKEEQEMKEKLLSRLAAAYSLEKMRKALKEFKQSLQTQRSDASSESSPIEEEAKAKRVAVKKESVDLSNEIPMFKGDKLEDFEEEQGAGHYLNGKNDQQFSEGYMGGSGRHRIPVVSTVGGGPCPVLAKIVQRCRGVDLLAGDRGQLFLPLCSLHQICYLCGEAPPTTCDLVFLSEADTTCEGDMGCQRAARSALMALRELHDNLADELDGECEASPCLPATLKLNTGWQRALQR